MIKCIKQECSVKMKKSFRQFVKDIPLYMMAMPGFLCLIIFSYLPMAGVIMAFQKYNARKGILGSEFVGLSNFKFLFASTDAWVITRNTILYNVAFILVNMLLSVSFALILSSIRSKKSAKVFQTIYMFPHFLSAAVIDIIVNAFIHRSNGVVNHFMAYFQGEEVLIDWYMESSIWPFLLILVSAWKGVGYETVLYLAVISGISPEYYEAAVIDGATRSQQARYVTIPHLKFAICIKLIMSVGGIMRGDFGLFYTVTHDSGVLYPVTDVLDTYIYRGLQSSSNFSLSTAAGLYQSTVGFILILFVNWIVNKIDSDSAMF